ncbi:hydrogenase expression/formation protein [Legionella gratiana]|uniref:Hydrogenase expression/formation protein n=1 Tax=Legionella gratiana TaxID=45066 RepID=A0A378JDW0_9GAMM|nr:hydrogenase maturation protease [Legionella gratiana]KTD13686.1 hydrogenase expression/formation protein [Legionella gratiana]STX46003.1 hydrogenase expression/formation protein [Legionella gratiana]
MKLIKVLGIGSPFGDDQAGWKVIEILKQQIALPSEIASYVIIESHDRPGARLIELINNANTVFLIDAIKSNKEIGTIHQFNKEEIIAPENQFSTHGIGVLQALQLANALNALPNNIIFYGIEIDVIVLDSTLSPYVQSAVEKLAAQLKKELSNSSLIYQS